MRDTLIKGERVLVTGSAGLVGSNLVKRLLAEGASVRATLHKRGAVVKDSNIDYIPCDLTLGSDCQKVVKDMRYIFHCAASTSGAAVITSIPMVHVTPNIVMNAQLLEAAYEAGVEKFLWLSSSTGYPPSNEEVREEEMFNGEPYEKYYFVGWTKRFSEILCKMYGEKLPFKMATIVLRPTNIYGPGDDFNFETSHVIPALIRRAVERHNPIEVWGTGNDVRDFLYVEDMVEAMIRAMERIDNYIALNIGSGKAYSVKQVLQAILELTDYSDAEVVFAPTRPSTIPVRLVNISKARSLLGFKPEVELRDGLQRTIDWFRRYGSLPCPHFPAGVDSWQM